MMNFIRMLLIFVGALGAVNGVVLANDITIQGKAFYESQDPSALQTKTAKKQQPPYHAVLMVQLVDTQSPGNRPLIVGEISLPITSQAPIPFQITIPDKTLIRNHQYALQARIMVGDVLWFVSDKRSPVDWHDLRKSYPIRLEEVIQPFRSISPSTPHLPGNKWTAEKILDIVLSKDSPPTIIIAETGQSLSNKIRYQVSGGTGCNQYTTFVSLNQDETNKDEGHLQFLPPSLTFLTCSTSIMQQENQFIDLLNQARLYQFDDLGRLILKDNNKKFLGRFIPYLQEKGLERIPSLN
ncbi:META domain-containing protein [Bartonella sp. DGB2]|uniref:META domain-containing protein n=1 Tax=Bartonella sp. DGB2 TaxID=3388426 RepID=UPI00398FB9BC